MTTVRRAASFKAFFNHNPEDDDGNKNTKAFTDALDDIDEKKRIKAFTEDRNAVFLAADNDGKVQVFHHPVDLGGTRTRPKNKVVAMAGLGSHGTAVQLDTRQAVNILQLRCPDLNLIDAENTATGIKTIAAPPDNAVVTCDATNIFLPAPWLRQAIFAEDSTCPFELILAARRASAEFCRTSCVNDQALQDEIKAHYDSFASWAWALGHKKIEALRIMVHPDDTEVHTFPRHCHVTVILPPVTATARVAKTPDTDSVMRQLNESISKSAE